MPHPDRLECIILSRPCSAGACPLPFGLVLISSFQASIPPPTQRCLFPAPMSSCIILPRPPHATQVLVSCVSGCTCNATHVNGLVKEVRNSQTDAHVLPVTESRDCVIRIVLMLVRPSVCVGVGGGRGEVG